MHSTVTNVYRFMLWLIIGYAIVLSIFTFFVFPTNDTFYYFTWSKHLQLSYYDGPPLIAYIIWLSTHIFGNSCFALQLIATMSVFIAAFLGYKIARLFNADRLIAIITALFIMSYPFATTRFMAISMTLDCLEVVFSLLIVYISFCLIKYEKIHYIYLLGISCGFGLLAKYNVILLIIGLMLYFAWNKQLRRFYSSYHLYLAGLIALGIFSPVLIWNYQHHWISFVYQLESHKWNGAANAINSSAKHGLRGIWFYLSSCVFGVLNVSILVMLYATRIRHVKISYNVYNSCLIFLIWIILIFWLIESYSAHVGLNYMVTVSSLLLILVSQQLVMLGAYRLSTLLAVIFVMLSVVMLINKSSVHPVNTANYQQYIKSGLIKYYRL